MTKTQWRDVERTAGARNRQRLCPGERKKAPGQRRIAGAPHEAWQQPPVGLFGPNVDGNASLARIA